MPNKKLIIETTSRCNMDCNYCYMQENRGENNPSISEVFEKSLERFMEHNDKRLSVIYHGGEPLILRVDEFEKFVLAEKRLNFKGLSIGNSIQTNGTLIDDLWARFLKDNSFRVGLSIDGPKKVHDANRVYPNGNGTFESIMESVDLMKEEKLRFGTISVLTKKSIGMENEIYDLIKEINPESAKLNFYSCAGRGSNYREELELSIPEKINMMKRFYDIYKNDENRLEQFAPFSKIIESLFTGRNSMCNYDGGCHVNSILVVDNRGDVYPCGRFIGDKDFVFGNVFRNSIEKIEESPLFKKIMERKSKLEEKLNLPFAQFHKGGCLYEALASGGDIMDAAPDYEYKEEIIKYIYDDVRSRLK